MNRPRISDYFDGAGVKFLTATDLKPTNTDPRAILVAWPFHEQFDEQRNPNPGPEPGVWEADYFWLSDEDECWDEALTGEKCGWLNVRSGDAGRPPKFRLVIPFENNPVAERASPGELLLVARKRSGGLIFLLCDRDTTIGCQSIALFGFPHPGDFLGTEDEAMVRIYENDGPEISRMNSEEHLNRMGVSIEFPEDPLVQVFIDKYGLKLPGIHGEI